jgi:hypothetical protein
MSHWAEIDKNNKVIRVTVGDNNDPSGDEGYQWLIDNLGGTWIKTSYNGKIRGNYAAIGDTYLPLEDIFMPPKCHTEAVLNAKAAKWECTNQDHKLKELNA